MSEPIKLMVLDLSHYDDPCDLYKARDAGIVGIIWKATQGTGYVDPTYNQYREIAIDAGLLWGAYHFAENADPKQEAAWFVKNAAIGENDLFCLDWEPYSNQTMSAQQAEAWVREVEDLLGRPNECVVYGSSSFLTDMIPQSQDAFFAKRRLWLAQFGPTPKVPPTWKDYWLWQYAADGEGPEPRTVAGIPGKPDCNSFPRTENELRAEWAWETIPAPEPPPPLTQDINLTIALAISGLPEGATVTVAHVHVVGKPV